MPQGTICLARLAAPVARPTQTDTARGRRSARIFRQALGLAVDRTARRSLCHGQLPPKAGNANTLAPCMRRKSRSFRGCVRPNMANLMLARGLAPSGIKCHGALLKFASPSTLSPNLSPNFVGSPQSLTRLASVSSRGISNKGWFARTW
jgi:hypothetical protein